MTMAAAADNDTTVMMKVTVVMMTRGRGCSTCCHCSTLGLASGTAPPQGFSGHRRSVLGQPHNWPRNRWGGVNRRGQAYKASQSTGRMREPASQPPAPSCWDRGPATCEIRDVQLVRKCFIHASLIHSVCEVNDVIEGRSSGAGGRERYSATSLDSQGGLLGEAGP